jgi:hypothetical protein
MSALRSLRPTPALVVAMVALVAAMSGAAVALPGKATVSTNDIKKQAITKKLIAKGAVGSKQIIGKSIKGNRLKDGAVKDKQIADGTITGAKVADDTLTDAKSSDYDVIGDAGVVRVTATEAGTEAAAQAAAPETELFSKGGLTLYAKCFRDTTGAGTVFGEIYARTSASGALMQGTNIYPNNNATLLDTNTIEEDAELDTQTVAVADSGTIGEAESALVSADGATDLTVVTHIAVKQGSFAGGNGAFGDGNVCLFGGTISG